MAVLTASAYQPLVQCQPSISEAFEQLTQFSVIDGRLWLSRGIWTISPQWAAEFRKLARGIWQNFPRKTVGPINHLWKVPWSWNPG